MNWIKLGVGINFKRIEKSVSSTLNCFLKNWEHFPKTKQKFVQRYILFTPPTNSHELQDNYKIFLIFKQLFDDKINCIQ